MGKMSRREAIGSVAASLVAGPQIRLADAEDQLVTLYEFRFDPRFANITEQSFRINGLEVSLWREDGLVCGLARPAKKPGE